MEDFGLKALSASVLWILSMFFGVILPYFLWKVSPPDKESQRQPLLIEDDNNDSLRTEADNLLSDTNGNGSGTCCEFFKRTAVRIHVRFSNSNFLSLVNCMCGGVFLGVSLLDLIPQSREAVTHLLHIKGITTNYPVAEFFVSMGLLMVMILEHVVTEIALPRRRNVGQRPPMIYPTGVVRPGSSGKESNIPLQLNDNSSNYDVAVYRMYILIITLSLHSVFEGLAIGLQEEVTTLVQLVVAISVHKSVLSFGIGLRQFETLGQHEKINVAIFCMIVFCSSSPLGCIIGALVSRDRVDSSPNAFIASVVLQCLAAGTFLYVTFVEVIPREFSHHHGEVKVGARVTIKADGEHRESDPPSPLRNDSSLDNLNAIFVASPKRSKRKQSGIVKLLSLIVGFAIVSGLQFL